jgi:hypothetical protein
LVKNVDSDSSAANTALADLVARLPSAADTQDPKARIGAIGEIQDAGAAHFSALLTQYLDINAGTYAAHEVLWKSLTNYQSRLTQVLCTVAMAAFTVESATRAMRAIRALAKLHLVHYAKIPGKVWKVAYAIHANAEKNGFATTPVHSQSGDRTMTSVEQEFLRLLILQLSAPDMMAPEQIEVADRAIEQLGGEFTLRQPGVADNPFCYEPESEFAPRRAKGRELPANARYFGPGMGYDSLERMARQLGSGAPDDFRPFGKDLSPLAQSSAVQHLLTFWRVDCPYSPPAHEPADGSLQVVHGYGHVWQYLSEGSQGAGELSLVDASVAVPRPPEVWELRGEGGSELSAEVPPASRAWAKCGALVGLSMGDPERWVGLIRRMHAGSDGSLQADIAVISGEPQAHSLREVLEQGDDGAFTNASSRQFGMSAVNTVVLADGTDSAQPPNLLMAAEHWRAGRVYELQEGDALRYLRGVQVIRRGVGFVRATFEWVSMPD